jgi:Ca-activated chloride channel homolog
MSQRSFLKFSSVIAILAAALIAVNEFKGSGSVVSAQNGSTQGALQVVGPNGPKAVCPLKHTDVKAQISGFLSRVTVTQEFENPFKEQIEAVYTFPLPQNAAVDDMTMVVGDRTVRGKILRREEAQAVYEAAKNNGQTASLLNQERPNIFTQSVANILPDEPIKITISYVETLSYENGSYEFVFPMVVGPRYIPGNPTGAKGNGFAPDTDRVPDGSVITPRPAPEGMRAGHDVSLEVTLDAGVPIDALASKTHDVSIERSGDHQAHVTLKDLATIPNKDFILRYDVAGAKISDAVLTHSTPAGGFFTMILQPPERVTVEDVTPKELIFVLDTSGSMSGFPIEKAKETMKLALDNLYPADTFNLITFAGDEHILFPGPVSATKENLAKAQAFLETRQGGGGTEMMKAIRASMDPSDKQDHVRIVCFMTDGYVGNEMEIISEVQKHPNARVFSFGIGSSVNRYLLDNMAKYGRGEVEYVSLNDDGSAPARRFHERVRNPLLTDISIDWNGMAVSDVYPKTIPDLFGAKPVIVNGRYTGNGRGIIRLKGKMSGRDFVRDIAVDFSSPQSHDVLATLWARMRVDDLMSQDFSGAQQGAMKDDVKQNITQLGLDYRLMTQFTSFVAVEEMVVTDGGQPRRIDVPVEVPEGVNRQMAYGDETEQLRPSGTVQFSGGMGRGVGFAQPAVPKEVSVRQQVMSPNATPPPSYGNAPRVADIAPMREPISGGVLNGKAVTLPAPIYAAIAKQSHASGAVLIEVLIDESGKVLSAKAVSGSPLLVGAAVKAAVQARFTPTVLSGRPVKVRGVITYNFLDDKAVGTVSGAEVKGSELLTPEQKFQALLQKLEPRVVAVVSRLKNPTLKPADDEGKFIHDGKAEVQVWLADKSEETMTKLKQLGFEIILDPKTAKMVIGRLPIEKLQALAELQSVRYVAPQTSR